jgi:hypothetical protein
MKLIPVEADQNQLSIQIALSCLHMACVILGKDSRQWFAELHVDFDKIQASGETSDRCFDF